jgi:hypothetical protein
MESIHCEGLYLVKPRLQYIYRTVLYYRNRRYMKTADKGENIKITLDSREKTSAVIKVSLVSMLRP